MNYHSNIVVSIAKNLCRKYHCQDLFDDLCQIGAMTYNRLSDRNIAYIIKSVENAMIKNIPKKQPRSIEDIDFPVCYDIPYTIDFFIEELSASETEKRIFTDHYIHNIPVKELACQNNVSVSSIYRLFTRLKEDFANVV